MEYIIHETRKEVAAVSRLRTTYTIKPTRMGFALCNQLGNPVRQEPGQEKAVQKLRDYAKRMGLQVEGDSNEELLQTASTGYYGEQEL